MALERKGIVTRNGRKGTFIPETESMLEDGKTHKIFKDPILLLLKKGMEESEIRNLFNKNMYEIFN
jgi:DNA-binding transcriptional regulator YhcF (GntR family)